MLECKKLGLRFKYNLVVCGCAEHISDGHCSLYISKLSDRRYKQNVGPSVVRTASRSIF